MHTRHSNAFSYPCEFCGIQFKTIHTVAKHVKKAHACRVCKKKIGTKQEMKVSFNRTVYLRLAVRKPAICICENKDAQQLCSNSAADQRLSFRYSDCTITLLPNSKFQNSNHILLLYSMVCVGLGHELRRPVDFLTTRLIL